MALLPWIRLPDPASRLLPLEAPQLPQDRHDRQRRRPSRLETFCGATRFRPTCCRTARSIHVGHIQNRGRLDVHHRSALPLNAIMLKPHAPAGAPCYNPAAVIPSVVSHSSPVTRTFALLVLAAGIAYGGPRSDDINAGWPIRVAVSPEARNQHLTQSARHIAGSSPRQILPWIHTREDVVAIVLFTNITDSEAEFSATIRGEDGLPLAIPRLKDGVRRLESSIEAVTVPPYSTRILLFPSENPASTGWIEFTAIPEASIVAIAYTYVGELINMPDGVGFSYYPDTVRQFEQTETYYRRAWVPIRFRYPATSHELVLINPASTGQQTLEVTFRGDKNERRCNASVSIPQMGQAVLDVATTLTCSAAISGGSIEIRASDDFSALLFSRVRGRPTITKFVQRPAALHSYRELEYWTIGLGQVTFGNVTYSNCLALSNSPVQGSTHTVHRSKWQTRNDDGEPWSDIPNTSQIGEICPYSPTQSGQYRAVAELSIGGELGTYTSSNILVVK